MLFLLLALLTKSSLWSLVVEIVFYIEMGPSLSRPRMLDAWGRGKVRLTLRLELAFILDPYDTSLKASGTCTLLEWKRCFAFALPCFVAKAKLTPLPGPGLYLMSDLVRRDVTTLVLARLPSKSMLW